MILPYTSKELDELQKDLFICNMAEVPPHLELIPRLFATIRYGVSFPTPPVTAITGPSDDTPLSAEELVELKNLVRNGIIVPKCVPRLLATVEKLSTPIKQPR